MLEIILKMFTVLLTCIVNASNHTKWVLLGNQKCMIQPTLFLVKLDRCAGGCCTLNDLSNKVCVSNKTEDLNLGVFIIKRKH